MCEGRKMLRNQMCVSLNFRPRTELPSRHQPRRWRTKVSSLVAVARRSTQCLYSAAAHRPQAHDIKRRSVARDHAHRRPPDVAAPSCCRPSSRISLAKLNPLVADVGVSPIFSGGCELSADQPTATRRRRPSSSATSSLLSHRPHPIHIPSLRHLPHITRRTRIAFRVQRAPKHWRQAFPVFWTAPPRSSARWLPTPTPSPLWLQRLWSTFSARPPGSGLHWGAVRAVLQAR